MDGLLTDDELRALELTGELANLLARICGANYLPNGPMDWNEAASDVHRIQHRIMAQAAARAYPDRFRLLGRHIGDAEET